MDNFFLTPENAVPPAEVRFVDLHAEPWPDGRRVRVHAELTPFQQKPNLEFTIYTLDGEEVASVTLLEVIVYKLVITMHIRRDEVEGRYQLSGRLSYPDLDTVDETAQFFEIEAPEAPEDAA